MSKIIGMIHLKALPGSPNNEYFVNEIYEFARNDMLTLQENRIKYAIVENMFDTPYSATLDLETIVSYVSIFTLLKQESLMSLGVNLHSTNDVEAIVIAELCGADFIRIENLVELRFSASGTMEPLGSKIMRKKEF